MRDLADIRVEIDQVDNEILSLFQKRMELACQVAEYKIATGKKVYDKAREDEKLEKLSSSVEDGFSQQAVKELYTQMCIQDLLNADQVRISGSQSIPVEYLNHFDL